MLTPSRELATAARRSLARVAVGSPYFKGPDVPAGFTFFGKRVYRTYLLMTSQSSPAQPVLVSGFGGMQDLVDVCGCRRFTLSTLEATLASEYSVIGTSSALRVRIDPTLEDTLEIYATLNEFGASESYAFTQQDIEFFIFWTK
jgi:hypothetical protein